MIQSYPYVYNTASCGVDMLAFTMKACYRICKLQNC